MKFGDGTFKWSENDKYSHYKGSFQMGNICGKGALTLRNGNVIEGIFDQNTIEDAVC